MIIYLPDTPLDCLSRAMFVIACAMVIENVKKLKVSEQVLQREIQRVFDIFIPWLWSLPLKLTLDIDETLLCK